MTSQRSLDDARTKADLLQQYIAECERIEAFAKEERDDELVGKYVVTDAERMEVFERRRDRLYNALQNSGIKLQAEAADTLPSIARAREGME